MFCRRPEAVLDALGRLWAVCCRSAGLVHAVHGLTPRLAGRGGGYRVLYDAGYEIDHMKEELFSRIPTAEEIKQLQLPAGEPVVELHRTTCTADGTVVEYAIGVHAASRFAWEYDFKVPDSAREEEVQP
ncbi:UTRA domain-containing protein [Streptomyces halstedii]